SIKPDAKLVRCGNRRCATLIVTGIMHAKAKPEMTARPYAAFRLTVGKKAIAGARMIAVQTIGAFSRPGLTSQPAEMPPIAMPTIRKALRLPLMGAAAEAITFALHP